MRTFIYMVRHGDSPKEGHERLRGLTEKGEEDVHKITEVLKGEGIQTVVSSPYKRSVLTVEPIAKLIEKEVVEFEDLKERVFTADDKRLADKELLPLLEQSFSEPDYALDGGESNADCQRRAVKQLRGILVTYAGQRIVVGTHGAVMTLMMGYFDHRFNSLEFLKSTTKPDIFRMEFDGERLVGVDRMAGIPDGEILKL
ncbi:histidine phosphatase family protein [Rossellomorea vietnamensis]|uniref:Histidine phosphatase family protein n=1 Tax=Rossellomorea vietnamensis TaxID=218284 RepID=A0A5D4MIM2_9BACI|nr:histidine phosphatase family protein [Rossellomorea vietnamensis]TYS01184.1 histidine phosphatase family protein [Rossellomorea vietnamensis]